MFRVRRVGVSSTTTLTHTQALQHQTAKYRIDRINCKVFSVPNGNLFGNQVNIFQGPLPVRVVIGMVDADVYNGPYTKNPFNFKNYNTTFLGLTVNGEHLPGKPLQLKFAAAGGTNYVFAYQTLYAGTNKMFQNQGNGITRDKYANGYTMYVFDLTADLCIGNHLHPIRNGNVSLECQFGAALDAAINIVVLGEFQNLTRLTPTATCCVILTTEMNTLQILNVLKTDPFTKSVFTDVLPSDRLPNQIQKRPKGYILNVDPSNGHGSHWIAIYLTADGKGEFFYSFGEPPEFYSRNFKTFLEDHSSTFTCNEKTLQSP